MSLLRTATIAAAMFFAAGEATARCADWTPQPKPQNGFANT